jgi:hypothetical protein
MDREELSKAVTPQEMAAAILENKDDLALLHRTHHRGPSVREDTYQGHRIRVVTSYDITVDGKPVTGHVFISNEGTVHYHAIPNQEFASMVDMVKSIIDLSPELGEPDSQRRGRHDHEDAGHDPNNHGEVS